MTAIRLAVGVSVSLASALALVVAAAYGADSLHPASAASMPDEQRLAERFDPQKIRERDVAHSAMVERLLAAHPAIGANPARPVTPASGLVNGSSYQIDGSRNPELFMPHEIFDVLINGVLDEPHQRVGVQASFKNALLKAGVEDDAGFWAQIAQIARPYLDLRRHLSESALVPAATPEEAADIQLCRARFAALTEARRTFSRDRFDDILYTAIAPTMHVSASATSSAAEIQSLLFAARGCR